MMAVSSRTARCWWIFWAVLWGALILGGAGLSGRPAWGQDDAAVGDGAVPAFPGAEGFGALTPHARGRKVFFVTRLDDEDTGGRYLKAGYFRKALFDAEQAGGGYILFKVAGTIQLKRSAYIPSNTYVAGQSAPGTGIAIEGQDLAMGTKDAAVHDVLVRHVRHRGNFRGRGTDACGVYGATTRRVVLDHVSISFFQDGAVDVTGGAEEVTVQWSHMGDAVESKTDEPYHGEPNLIAYGGNKVTFHHNYYTHSHSRVPYMWEGVENGQVEFSNNVVYNYRKYPSTLDGPRGIGNVLGNVYVAGKNTHSGDAGLPIRPVVLGSRGFRVHLAGNYGLGGLGHDNRNDMGTAFKGSDQTVRRGRPAWVWGARESERDSELNMMGAASARVGNVPGVFEFAPQRFAELPPVTITPAQENALRVMRLFGALPRDKTDERLYQEFVNRTGEWKMERPADNNEYSGEPLPDRDADGLPDAYEAQHKKNLDPNGHDLHPVYDNLEVYLQERSVQLEEGAPQIALTWNDILQKSQPPASAGPRPPGAGSASSKPAPSTPTPSPAPARPPARVSEPSAPARSAPPLATALPAATANPVPTTPASRRLESQAPSAETSGVTPGGADTPAETPGSAPRSWLSLGLLWLAGTAGVLALVWAGLRGRSQPPPSGEVHPVVGKLLLNDSYPEGALVVLHPLSPLITTHPRATVRADGSFQVSTFAEGDGAPAGDYLVSAVWYKAGLKNGQPALSGNQLPPQYAQPQTSGWSLKVVPGVNELPTWQIES
jgi:hypothetical protein